MPRFHCPADLAPGAELALPPGAARHVQVLRMQPGESITLFNGAGGEWTATITRMGRSDVQVIVQTHDPIEREAPRAVHLALGMPANERMDWLVEKATELGVASIQPLQTAHGVLRLKGERADKKQAHWQAVAIAAAEQCGRNRVPPIHPVQDYADWLAAFTAPPGAACYLLSLREGSQNAAAATDALNQAPIWFLSGPEGGLQRTEEDAALARGFQPLSLGPRVLRAETAALAALVLMSGSVDPVVQL